MLSSFLTSYKSILKFIYFILFYFLIINRIDGIQIRLEDFEAPETENTLIIEGAGGLMVPLNDSGDMVADLIPVVADEAVLVSMNYLGSINHTLLSVELMKQKNIPITGIIFNGDPNPETEAHIR